MKSRLVRLQSEDKVPVAKESGGCFCYNGGEVREMLSKQQTEKNKQLVCISIEDLVPPDHLVRKIVRVMDFTFIYKVVEDRYSPDTGRPSIDPVVLVKMVMLQYLFGIRSMRQTVKEIEVNMAYRWFLGLSLTDTVPHFTTFGKNYTRRFEGTTLFEDIFARILEQCYDRGFIKDDTVYVDATHVKASANRHKRKKVEVVREAAAYAKELRKEIDADRAAHEKKPLGKDDDDEGSGSTPPTKHITQSTTDPESGMFVKGEHKRDFAYMAQTACDRNGFVLHYEVAAGNAHDSVSFPALYEKLKPLNPCIVVMDAGYKTPYIVRMMIKDGIIPLLPRTAPKTGKGLFRKYEYVYDEYHDCYICPNNLALAYSTTTREGYREYKSKSYHCLQCPYRAQCTRSTNATKVVTHHVWQDYMEMAEGFRLTLGMRDVYRGRKETIERVFADAKEKHGMRYTHYRGMAKLRFEIGMTFACMNLKKLATWVAAFVSLLCSCFLPAIFLIHIKTKPLLLSLDSALSSL